MRAATWSAGALPAVVVGLRRDHAIGRQRHRSWTRATRSGSPAGCGAPSPPRTSSCAFGPA